MRITVLGLWHLGCVTAACLASEDNQVVGMDLNSRIVSDLNAGMPPLHEPGLAELIATGLGRHRLSFTADPVGGLRGAEILWVTFDTPVNERDEADVAFVRAQLESISKFIEPQTLILISSQVPVGFTRALERDWSGRSLSFAYSPENLRLGKAIDAFRKPERVIIGTRNISDQSKLATLFGPFCRRLEWMSVESAEMTKHALNAFLATSVTFINEIARLCEVLGADAREVERGLKSEGRIGPRAYLAPGSAFAGGTLARDLRYLVAFGKSNHVDTPLFGGVLESNALHANWMHDKLHQILAGRSPAVVAIFGLTYTAGTSTLRRSASVELAVWLHQQGIRVQAHDPAVDALPDELNQFIVLCNSPQEAMTGADAVVIATEWPDYRNLQANEFVQFMRLPQVIDQNWFMAKVLAGDDRIAYFATGKNATR